MWTKLICWLYGWISLFAMRYIYGPWSRFWRNWFETRYTEMPVQAKPWTIQDILSFFRKCTWTKDKWYGGFDVISKPEKLWETHHGDCDEFAVFASEVLPRKRSFILSVVWYRPKAKKKFGGHNICLYPKLKTFYDEDSKTEKSTMEWWHIGNWGNHGPYQSIYETIDSIPPKDAIGCAWSLRVPRARNKKEKDLEFKFGGRFKHLKKETK